MSGGRADYLEFGGNVAQTVHQSAVEILASYVKIHVCETTITNLSFVPHFRAN